MYSDVVHSAFSSSFLHSFVFCLFFCVATLQLVVLHVEMKQACSHVEVQAGKYFKKKNPKNHILNKRKLYVFLGNGTHQYLNNIEITSSLGDD